MSTESLLPGMKIARDVYSYASTSTIPLLCAGQPISQKIIDQLLSYEIIGIYIEREGTDDIIPNEFIGQELRSKALKEVHRVFEAFSSAKGVVKAGVISGISGISRDLVANILSREVVFVNLMDLKSHDDYTYTHSLCVSILSVATGISLGYDYYRLQELCTAAILHDVGKVRTPPEILNKPGALTEDEFELIKHHPGDGESLLRRSKTLSEEVLQGIRGHHEKCDGTGYPSGLSGDKIHPFAKIISICDVYDALTSNRSYKKACFPSEAVEYIMGSMGSKFDEEIVAAFLRKIIAFPDGGLVRLSNGMTGVVVRNSPDNALRPRIRVFYDNFQKTKDIDLLSDPGFANVTIVGMDYGDSKGKLKPYPPPEA